MHIDIKYSLKFVPGGSVMNVMLDCKFYRHLLSGILMGLLVIPYAANAQTMDQVEVTCPLGGEVFQATLAMSGTAFGTYLDFRPYGPIASPPPLPKCPSNGFVVYKRKFNDDELQRIKPYVVSQDYQALQRTHTNYYLAAKLQTHLGASQKQLARTLLYASWETERSEQYREYATEALEAYKRALTEEYPKKNEWLTDQLVAGELERRLGRFEEANSRFLFIADREKASSGTLHDILELQLRLLKAKNSEPNLAPQPNAGNRPPR